MAVTKWQLAITSICLITGILLTITLQAQENSKINPTSQRSENLASIAEDLQEETSLLEAEISDLRKDLSEYQKARSGGESHLADLQRELHKAQLEAGLLPVSGPGIIFTLDDRKEALNEALIHAQKNGDVITDYWPYLVHDSYLTHIVNDLRNAGAEAISINGERIVTTSEVKCGGYIVFVNGQQLSAPYTIKAIGNPDKLKEAIEGGYTFGIINFPNKNYPFTLTKNDNLQITPYKSSYNIKFATTETKEEKKEENNVDNDNPSKETNQSEEEGGN